MALLKLLIKSLRFVLGTESSELTSQVGRYIRHRTQLKDLHVCKTDVPSLHPKFSKLFPIDTATFAHRSAHNGDLAS